MVDSDDEDDMEDSSDEDAQFAVDDIMEPAQGPTTAGYPGSRSGSGSGSASGSVGLGTGIPGITAEGGMDVDVPMASGGTTALGSGKLSNRTSMSSLRGFTSGTPDESGIVRISYLSTRTMSDPLVEQEHDSVERVAIVDKQPGSEAQR
jgi:hypothetical protein